MTHSGDLVIQSLERVAELIDDPAPAVFELLFARNPEFEPLFVLDPNGAIRRNMLQLAVVALMDYVEGRASSVSMVRAERMNHAHIGVPGPRFDEFYAVVRDAFRAMTEAQWSAATQDAWTEAIEGLTRQTS
jgi:hemoglobin-like flavoprotein